MLSQVFQTVEERIEAFEEGAQEGFQVPEACQEMQDQNLSASQ
jgi:hypothetical protein